MLIPLPQLLTLKYPDIKIGPFEDTDQVVLSDHNDGNGAYIHVWNYPHAPQPTQTDLDQWQIDLVQTHTFQQNAITNAPILGQLQEIDAKSIRSLRENNTAMLSALTSQAAALRAQLLPTH